MHRAILAIVFIFLLNYLATAQIPENYGLYYNMINKAEISTYEKSYKIADSLYTKAFALVKNPFRVDLEHAIANLSNLTDFNQKIYNYAMMSVTAGKKPRQLKRYIVKSDRKEFIKESSKVRALYLSSLDSELQISIRKMIKKDQKYRKWPFAMLSSYKTLRRIDQDNYDKLLKIIKSKGWPGFSKIGEDKKGKYDVTGSVALLLLHFSPEQNELLMPILLNQIRFLDMYPHSIARIKDYDQIKINKNPLYGTYTSNFKGSKYFYQVCNEDFKEINKRREKLFLETIEEYGKKRGITISKNHCK